LASDDPTPKPADRRPAAEHSGWDRRFFGLAKPRVASEADDERREKWAVAGAGMELAAGIGLFAGLGYLIDWWLGSLPWGTVIGALLGMAAGMYQLIKTVNRVSDPGRPAGGKKTP
jgi:F0F1-type ATP synthase assembly protein I